MIFYMRTYYHNHEDTCCTAICTCLLLWGHMLKYMRTHDNKSKDIFCIKWGQLFDLMRTHVHSAGGHMFFSIRTYVIMYEETNIKPCVRSLSSMCPHALVACVLMCLTLRTHLPNHVETHIGTKLVECTVYPHAVLHVEVARQKHVSSCNFSSWLPPYGWSMCPHAFFACGRRTPIGMLHGELYAPRGWRYS